MNDLEGPSRRRFLKYGNVPGGEAEYKLLLQPRRHNGQAAMAAT
jgi:hypothetical protein